MRNLLCVSPLPVYLELRPSEPNKVNKIIVRSSSPSDRPLPAGHEIGRKRARRGARDSQSRTHNTHGLLPSSVLLEFSSSLLINFSQKKEKEKIPSIKVCIGASFFGSASTRDLVDASASLPIRDPAHAASEFSPSPRALLGCCSAGPLWHAR